MVICPMSPSRCAPTPVPHPHSVGLAGGEVEAEGGGVEENELGVKGNLGNWGPLPPPHGGRKPWLLFGEVLG